jgi:hypothetical protein
MSARYVLLAANALVLSCMVRYWHGNRGFEQPLNTQRIVGEALTLLPMFFLEFVRLRLLDLDGIEADTNFKILLVATYRALWHPLAKYPGPFWGALSDWYTVYHILKGDRHIDFYRLHEKYGKSHPVTRQHHEPL